MFNYSSAITKRCNDIEKSYDSIFDCFLTETENTVYSYETEDEEVFYINVPGLSKDNSSVTLEGDILCIKGTYKIGEKSLDKVEKLKFVNKDNLDLSNIRVKFKDGIAFIIVKKKSEKKTKIFVE